MEQCDAQSPESEGSNTKASIRPWHAALVLFLVTMCFALITNHVWEDHYITYRCSVNLATGNGPVFTPGEHVHAFTSVLNMAIPALLRYLLGEGSDRAVLWSYRIICSLLLSASAYLICRSLLRYGFKTLSLAGALVLVFLESKVVDYTINGQEVALMIFFLTLGVVAILGHVKRPWLILAISWAGAMYTRPDGFIYSSSAAIGFFLFFPFAKEGRTRIGLLKTYVLAGVISFCMFLPWMIWAQQYYGSFVPHTVIAKGLELPRGKEFLHYLLVQFFFGFRYDFASVGMPTLYVYGPWNCYLEGILRQTSFFACIYFLCPWATRSGRALSLAALISLTYLNYIPVAATSWYFPNAWFYVALSAGFILHDLRRLSDWIGQRAENLNVKFWLKFVRRFIPGLLMTVIIAMTMMVCQQMYYQQRIIENSVRTKIGLWLKEHARTPKDTVFLECLGYLGYFSNMKIYDCPGLGSPEVVKARLAQDNVNDWGGIVIQLKPDWIVARPRDEVMLKQFHPDVLDPYEKVIKFDNFKAILEPAWMPGRNYLCGDAIFTIYRRKDLITDADTGTKTDTEPDAGTSTDTDK